MFCPKCGEQLNDNASFCGHCGHKMNESNNAGNNANTIDVGKEKLSEILSGAKKVANDGIKKIGENVNSQTIYGTLGKAKEILGTDPTYYFISLLTMFFATMFMFTATYYATSSLVSYRVNARSADSGWNTFFVIEGLICLGGFVATLLPIILKKKLKRGHMLASKICYIIVLAVFIGFRLLIAIAIASSGYGMFGAGVSLSFTGYLFYIFAIASIALSFVVSSKIPKNVKNFEYYNMPYGMQNNANSNSTNNSQDFQNNQNRNF